MQFASSFYVFLHFLLLWYVSITGIHFLFLTKKGKKRNEKKRNEAFCGWINQNNDNVFNHNLRILFFPFRNWQFILIIITQFLEFLFYKNKGKCSLLHLSYASLHFLLLRSSLCLVLLFILFSQPRRRKRYRWNETKMNGAFLKIIINRRNENGWITKSQAHGYLSENWHSLFRLLLHIFSFKLSCFVFCVVKFPKIWCLFGNSLGWPPGPNEFEYFFLFFV